MSGVEIGSAYVTILPDGSRIGPEVKRQFGVVGSEADRAGKTGGKRFGGAFNSTAKAVLGAAGGALALSKLAGFLGDSIGEAREAAEVGRRTDNVIKSMGHSSKVTAKHVGDLAGKISAKVGMDDEAIQSGENLLLTFGKVRNEAGKGNKIFDRTTGLMVDMSAAMGTDMKGAAIQLGKALNDPVKGMSALSRVGVSFTAQQKLTTKALVEGGDANALMAMGLVDSNATFQRLIKAQDGDVAKTVESLTHHLTDAQKKRYEFLTEGGHQLEAQKGILKEVEKEFKGAGKAAADPAKKMQVAYGNLKEQIGTELLPMADRFADFLTKKGIPAISGFLDEMKTGKGKGGQAAELFHTIRDDAKAAARFVGKVADKFNELPDPIKKGLAGAAVGLFAANKAKNALGLGSLRGATPATPMWVKVAGAGGGIPTGGPRTKGGGGGGWGAAAATLGVEFIISRLPEKSPFDPIQKSVKLAPQLEGMFGKGMDKSAGGLLSAVGKFDKAFAASAKGDGASAFARFQATAERAGLSLAELGELLPKTRDKINKLGGGAAYAKDHTENWRQTILGTNKQLDKLDAKHPNVRVKDNIPSVLAHVGQLDKALDDATRTRDARVRLAKFYAGKDLRVPGIQARALGGPVRAGQPYIVGERRPELFVPSQNGRIEPRVLTSGAGNTFNHYGNVVAPDPRKYVEWNDRRARQASAGGADV